MTKENRQPSQKKAARPIQECPAPEKNCYLTALEIQKGDKSERTRWGKTCEKFVVFPATVRQAELSNEDDGFSVFFPVSVNDPGPPKLHLVAVRPNLVDDDNQAMTIEASLREPHESEKGDEEHSGADDHHALMIDREDASALRTKAEKVIEDLSDAEALKKKIKESWEEWERRRKKLEEGLEKVSSDPLGASDSISEALTFEEDEEDSPDGEDEEKTRWKLKATVYPQDPTISKLLEKAPGGLASWCPEKFDWAKKLPKLVDVLRAVWLPRFKPRVYNIWATSCGEAEPAVAESATQTLKAQLLVYPADQFKFMLRVPKLASASASYDGRYISKDGEFKSVKTSNWEVAGVGTSEEPKGETASGEESEEASDAEGEASSDLYDPDKADKDDDKDEDKEKDDKDDKDEGTTLFQIEEGNWVLPWDEEEDDGDGDKDDAADKDDDAADEDDDAADKDDDAADKDDDDADKDDDDADKDDDAADKDDDDEWDAEVEKALVKIVRLPQEAEEEAPAEQDSEEEADSELDLSESLNAIREVVQSFREVWDKTKGLSFTVGFSIDAKVGFLEGKMDWEWGWRESPRLTETPTEYVNGIQLVEPDRQLPLVVFSQTYRAKLKIISLELALKLGLDLTYSGIGFRAALVGTISGDLHYEAEGVKEYCPEMQEYFKADPENWTVSTIKGKLEAKAVLLSADTFRASSEMETGYWVRAKRGDDERPQIEYEWRFLGLEMQAEFKLKGYKVGAVSDVVVLEATPEDDPHTGTFPTYASKTLREYREQLQGYKVDCWKIQEDMQRMMTEARIAYFAKFFPRLVGTIQASRDVKGDSLVWGTYDSYAVKDWISQLRGIAKTAPDRQIAHSIQHYTRRGVRARSAMTSWAQRTQLWDDELDGMLVPEDTDLDVEGQEIGTLLWYLRILGAFYVRFVSFSSVLLAYCDEAIALSRQAENAAVEEDVTDLEPSADFKKSFENVLVAYKDLFEGPEGRDDVSGWKEGKFEKACERVLDYIEGLNMTRVRAQLRPRYDRVSVRRGRLKFKYSLAKGRGVWRDEELTDSAIKWQSAGG